MFRNSSPGEQRMRNFVPLIVGEQTASPGHK